MHPGCSRRIVVERRRCPEAEGYEYIAHFSMTDVGPPGIGHVVKIACDEHTMGREQIRHWSFEARISPDGEHIDAGDGIHVGRFREANPDDEAPWEGIRFRDGNRWVLLGRPEEVGVLS